MNILVADDEPLARQRLVALLARLPGDHRVVAEAGDGAEALAACHRWPVDLALLDIRMPGLDGLQVAQRLALLERPPAVVFVTAYGDYALDAFNAQALDYVLKPVRLERLSEALQRARRLTRAQLDALRERPLEEPGEQLCAHYRGGVECVPLAEVIYLRAEQKYVVARHTRGRLVVDASLAALDKAHGDRFLRVHRNALAARRWIAGLEKAADDRWRLRLRGCEETLEISRRHLAGVRRWLREQEIGTSSVQGRDTG